MLILHIEPGKMYAWQGCRKQSVLSDTTIIHMKLYGPTGKMQKAVGCSLSPGAAYMLLMMVHIG